MRTHLTISFEHLLKLMGALVLLVLLDACSSTTYSLHPIHRKSYPAKHIHVALDTLSEVAIQATYLGNTKDELVFWIHLENLSDQTRSISPKQFYYRMDYKDKDGEQNTLVKYATLEPLPSPKKRKKSKTDTEENKTIFWDIMLKGSEEEIERSLEEDPFHIYSRAYSKQNKRDKKINDLKDLIDRSEFQLKDGAIRGMDISQGYVAFPIPEVQRDLKLFIRSQEENIAMDFELD